jgi:hypothetical protein
MTTAKLIKLDSGTDANGNVTSLWYICPTKELRDLIIRQRERLLPGVNYGVAWKDTQGFGLELAIVNWKPLSQFYCQ